MTYCIQPLPRATFEPVFALDDLGLFAVGARRMIVEKPNCTPCRISLQDAKPGESVLLVHFDHITDPDSPYRAGAAIYVREAATEAVPKAKAPEMLTRRLLSARVFNHDWMMMEADVFGGAELDERLAKWMDQPSVAEVHIHTAKQGCYLAAAVRT